VRADLREQELCASQRITWILHPDLVARCKEDAYRDVDSVLRAGGYDDLFRIAAYISRSLEILTKRSA
jgi:hypothetical protein